MSGPSLVAVSPSFDDPWMLVCKFTDPLLWVLVNFCKASEMPGNPSWTLTWSWQQFWVSGLDYPHRFANICSFVLKKPKYRGLTRFGSFKGCCGFHGCNSSSRTAWAKRSSSEENLVKVSENPILPENFVFIQSSPLSFIPCLTIQRKTVKGTKNGRSREVLRQATFTLKITKEKTLRLELLVLKLHSPATISLKYVPVQITTYIGWCLLNFPLCASVQKRGYLIPC